MSLKSVRAVSGTLLGVGNHISKQSIVYGMLVTAFVVLIASICVPYYTDSTGVPSSVYGSGKDCLGYTGMDCMTMHALPVLTILFVALTLITMTTHVSIPFLSKLPGLTFIKTKVAKIFEGFGISVPICLMLAMIFGVVTLSTQLGMPLSGSSLADQAKNSTTPTTFKDGMALSATGVALIIFAFLIQTEALGKVVHFMIRKLV